MRLWRLVRGLFGNEALAVIGGALTAAAIVGAIAREVAGLPLAWVVLLGAGAFLCGVGLLPAVMHPLLAGYRANKAQEEWRLTVIDQQQRTEKARHAAQVGRAATLIVGELREIHGTLADASERQSYPDAMTFSDDAWRQNRESLASEPTMRAAFKAAQDAYGAAFRLGAAVSEREREFDRSRPVYSADNLRRVLEAVAQAETRIEAGLAEMVTSHEKGT